MTQFQGNKRDVVVVVGSPPAAGTAYSGLARAAGGTKHGAVARVRTTVPGQTPPFNDQQGTLTRVLTTRPGRIESVLPHPIERLAGDTLGPHMAVRPTYSVQVGWSQVMRGLFTFGVSQFGGTDLLAADSWSRTFNGPYDDITQPGDGSRVDRVSVRRGRSDDLKTIDASTATVEIRDPAGRYDRKNTASPLYGLIDDNLHPIRIIATYGGSTYGIYYGFVRSVEAEPVGQRGGVATLECVDFFYVLNEIFPVIATMTNTTTGAAIGAILDYMQWRDPALRSLAVGDNIPAFTADGTKSALQLIQDLLEAERGIFFVDGFGVVTYMSRNQRYLLASSGLLDSVMEQRAVGHDADSVTNRWTVLRTGGLAQVAADVTSGNKWQVRDDSLESAYLANDNQALALAQYLVSRTKNPATPLWSLGYRANKTDDLMTKALAWDVGRRITVSEDRRGTIGDYFIEQVEHQIEQGHRHQVSYVLSEVPATAPFIFGVSTFGGTNVLAY